MLKKAMRVALSGALLFGVLASGSAPLPARQLGSDSPLVQPADPAAYHALQRQARAFVLEKQDFNAAEPLLEQLTRDYPLDRLNWSLLATTKRNLGKCAEAIPAYAKSIEMIGPWYSQARYFTAVCQLRLGNKAAALDALEKHVFEDATVSRPTLYDDPEFKSLRDDPRFRKIAGVASGPKLSRVAGYRADLDYLMAEIKRLSPHYRKAPLPARTTTAYRALHRDIPRLSDEQIYARMAEVLGTLDANHTLFRRLPGAGGESQFERYLPIKLYAFPEGFYVVDADAANQDLVGKRVVAIGSTPVEQAFRKVAGAMSAGSDIEIYWTAPSRMTEAHLLAGLGIVPDSKKVQLRLAADDGSTIERTLATTSKDTWSKLVAPRGVAAPRRFARLEEAHWFESWPRQSTTYVQFNQVVPDKDQTIAEFGLDLRKELERNPARNLIVDLRNNNGGDTFGYPELLRTLIAFSAKEGNQLYVLIGRNTYSAAANFTAELERLASPILVGEPTGDSGNQDGDEGHIRLPHSGWGASVGAVWWQLSTPWDQRRSIPPQVPVQLTAKAYFAGADPALETAQKLAAARPAK